MKKLLFMWGILFPSLSYGAELPLVTLEFPPFNYTQNRKVVGASTEILQHVLTQMGHTPVFRSIPWKRAQLMIKKGKAAGIYTYTYSPERFKYAYYSNPISFVRDVFFKRKKDHIKWQKLSDISDKLTGASGGFNYWKGFNKAVKEKVLNTNFVIDDTPNLLILRMLKIGRTDVFICEISVCSFLIKKHKPDFDNLNYIDKEIGPARPFYVGFSKKWPHSKQIRDEFNKHFEKLISSGKLLQIYEKYGVDTNFSKLGSRGASLLDKAGQKLLALLEPFQNQLFTERR